MPNTCATWRHDEGTLMDAGNRLDALIADKIFGMTLAIAEEDMRDSGTGERIWEGDYYERRGDSRVSIEPYSTKIAAAWKVVDAINGTATDKDAYLFDLWSDALYEDDGETRFCLLLDMTAKEAAHAICVAALNAIQTSSKQQVLGSFQRQLKEAR